MAEIGDMVTVKKTKMLGKVVRKTELFGKAEYLIEQLNGKRVKASQNEIQE
ncbi:hypothetical protein SEA_ENYGMA_220 [Streptomyces phage Enygma]